MSSKRLSLHLAHLVQSKKLLSLIKDGLLSPSPTPTPNQFNSRCDVNSIAFLGTLKKGGQLQVPLLPPENPRLPSCTPSPLLPRHPLQPLGPFSTLTSSLAPLVRLCCLQEGTTGGEREGGVDASQLHSAPVLQSVTLASQLLPVLGQAQGHKLRWAAASASKQSPERRHLAS